jgi:DNA repair protein RadA/Sms
MCLILAVLEKRLGLKFYQNDVYVNVIGGLSVSEPAADLAVAIALISSLKDRIVPDNLIVIGELGLAGECRAVSNPEQRVREAARLGFTRAVVPFRNVEKRPIEVEGMEIVPVKSIFEVIRELKEYT